MKNLVFVLSLVLFGNLRANAAFAPFKCAGGFSNPQNLSTVVSPQKVRGGDTSYLGSYDYAVHSIVTLGSSVSCNGATYDKMNLILFNFSNAQTASERESFLRAILLNQGPTLLPSSFQSNDLISQGYTGYVLNGEVTEFTVMSDIPNLRSLVDIILPLKLVPGGEVYNALLVKSLRVKFNVDYVKRTSIGGVGDEIHVQRWEQWDMIGVN